MIPMTRDELALSRMVGRILVEGIVEDVLSDSVGLMIQRIILLVNLRAVEEKRRVR